MASEPAADEAVAERLGVPVGPPGASTALQLVAVSLNDAGRPVRTLVADEVPDALAEGQVGQVRERPAEAVDALPAHQAVALRLHFGLGGDRPYTLREVARAWGSARRACAGVSSSACARSGRTPTCARWWTSTWRPDSV